MTAERNCYIVTDRQRTPDGGTEWTFAVHPPKAPVVNVLLPMIVTLGPEAPQPFGMGKVYFLPEIQRVLGACPSGSASIGDVPFPSTLNADADRARRIAERSLARLRVNDHPAMRDEVISTAGSAGHRSVWEDVFSPLEPDMVPRFGNVPEGYPT